MASMSEASGSAGRPGGGARRAARGVVKAYRRFRRLSRAVGPAGALRCMGGKGGLVRLEPRRGPGPLWLRPGDSDVEVLLEVLVDGECDLPASITSKPVGVIVDGGANVGYSSYQFALDNPGATVIAVEPDPGNVELLRKNTEAFKDRVKVLGCAIWSSDGHVRVTNPGAASWELCFEPCGPEAAGAVACMSVDSMLRSAGVERADVVKMDIEGAELEVFTRGDLGWLDRTRAVIIETHGPAADAAVRSALTSRGFSLGRQGEKLVAWR